MRSNGMVAAEIPRLRLSIRNVALHCTVMRMRVWILIDPKPVALPPSHLYPHIYIQILIDFQHSVHVQTPILALSVRVTVLIAADACSNANFH
jgi:hypothetical protein